MTTTNLPARRPTVLTARPTGQPAVNHIPASRLRRLSPGDISLSRVVVAFCLSIGGGALLGLLLFILTIDPR